MSIQRVVLTVTTPPSAEPVTLAEVKDRLGLSSTVDDSRITANITAARVYAERITGRSLAAKTYAAFYDYFPAPNHPLDIPAPPCISVVAVKYLDSTLTQQTWDPAEYTVASLKQPIEAAIVPKANIIYPCPYGIAGAVEVDFIAGYGAEGGPTIPEDWAEGIRQLAIHIYSHPEVITSEGLKAVPSSLMPFFRSTGKLWSF